MTETEYSRLKKADEIKVKIGLLNDQKFAINSISHRAEIEGYSVLREIAMYLDKDILVEAANKQIEKIDKKIAEQKKEFEKI